MRTAAAARRRGTRATAARRRAAAIRENCVACCVSPKARAARLVRKNAVHAVLRDAANDFELCRFRCLTNSGSTLHQNSYRSATERHCFGSVRPPLDPRMSINSAKTLQSLTRNGHADRRDPYIGDGRQMIFPCDVEGCAAPRTLLARRRDPRGRARGKTRRSARPTGARKLGREPSPRKRRDDAGLADNLSVVASDTVLTLALALGQRTARRQSAAGALLGLLFLAASRKLAPWRRPRLLAALQEPLWNQHDRRHR